MAESVLEEVGLVGSPRTYFAASGFRDRRFPKYDGRIRILGPLDSLLWDRALVRTTFNFDYVWEVYKPASTRRWGWYVCPLLHKDALVGRRAEVIFVDDSTDNTPQVILEVAARSSTPVRLIRPLDPKSKAKAL